VERAVGVGEAVHEARRDVDAGVPQRGQDAGVLHEVHREALPEHRGVPHAPVPGLRRVHDARGLARQAQVRLSAPPEPPQVLIPRLVRHQLADLDGPRVRRVRQDAGGRQDLGLVRRAVPEDLPVLGGVGVRHLEHRGRRDQALLDGRGDRRDLARGARLVDVLDRSAAAGVVGARRRVVRVHGVGVRQRQDPPGAHLLDHNRAPRRAVAVDRVVDHLLRRPLEVAIDRQVHRLPGNRVPGELLAGGDDLPRTVADLDRLLPRLTLEM